MWKVLAAIALGGIGAYSGGRIALADANYSALQNSTLDRSDVLRIVDYGTAGAVGLPLAVGIASLSVGAISKRDFNQQLRVKGVEVVDRLGMGGDVGVAVDQVLSEIEP